MNTLVIDTSTSRTCVALIVAGAAIINLHHDDALAHGEVLPIFVSQILSHTHHIDRVVIGMGPGPFTGLRSGIAFGQSFALARDIPWLGVCSLDGIVPPTGEGVPTKYVVATDAKRKEVFWACYVDGRRVTPPNVGSPKTLELLKQRAFGEGAVKFGLSNEIEFIFPDPVILSAAADTGEHFHDPIYIRRPDAFPPPANITFRAMNAMDLVSVFDIEKRSYFIDPWSMSQLKEELHGKNRWYLVAEFEDAVVGYVGALQADDVTDVLTLTVHPDHRRKGIARELLRRLIDWARVHKSVAVMLETREGNIQAIPLYQSFGFVEISRRENYYGPGITGIVMRKDLT